LSQPSAARVYFQAVETRLARQYDQQWAQQVQERWQKHHSTLAKARQRLEELDQRGEDSLSPDERWDRIAACWELDELDRLVELCRWTLERDPQHAGANYYLGRALLQREDPAGVPHLEAAMRRDPDAIVPVCMLLFSFYARRNDQENAERFRKIGMEREILLQQVEAERSTMDPKAQLEAHGWNAEDVAALREQLSRIPEVREAYLARRVVRHMPEQPCYVLCLVPHTSWWRGFDQDKSAHFVHTVARQVSARCELKVFSLALALKPLRKQLQQIPGTRIQ
jgi:lipopolysaccharide biosynthesis regulator YciM